MSRLIVHKHQSKCRFSTVKKETIIELHQQCHQPACFHQTLQITFSPSHVRSLGTANGFLTRPDPLISKLNHDIESLHKEVDTIKKKLKNELSSNCRLKKELMLKVNLDSLLSRTLSQAETTHSLITFGSLSWNHRAKGMLLRVIALKL